MDFHDFTRILKNLGVETDHSPKMCAGLADTTNRSGARLVHTDRPKHVYRWKHKSHDIFLGERETHSNTLYVRTCSEKLPGIRCYAA